MRLRLLAAVSVTGALLLPLAACGSSGDSKNEIKIAYQRATDNNSRVMDNFLGEVKKQFEKANPGKKVELVPIQASENDYYTKLQQMMRSPKTAPDLVYEDTFLINSDIKAGVPAPAGRLHRQVGPSGASSRTPPRSAGEGAGRQDVRRPGRHGHPRRSGSTRRSSRRPACPPTGSPRAGTTCSTRPGTIKKKVPGVTPLNVYTGKADGEAAAMQGFEMLLYGTDGPRSTTRGRRSGSWAARASRTR